MRFAYYRTFPPADTYRVAYTNVVEEVIHEHTAGESETKAFSISIFARPI